MYRECSEGGVQPDRKVDYKRMMYIHISDLARDVEIITIYFKYSAHTCVHMYTMVIKGI